MSGSAATAPVGPASPRWQGAVMVVDGSTVPLRVVLAVRSLHPVERGVLATAAVPVFMWFGRLATAEDDTVRGALAGAAGLTAQWCLLVLVVLMSHVPAVSRVYDQRSVLEQHMRLGTVTVAAVLWHVALLDLLFPNAPFTALGFTELFLADAALVFLLATAISAAPRVPHLLRFEEWLPAHRLAILALVASVFHEISAPSVDWGRLVQAVWVLAHIAVIATYVWFRLLRPGVYSRDHELCLTEVTPVGLSRDKLRRAWRLRITGTGLDGLAPPGVTALGYAYLRFDVAGETWTGAHPVSVVRHAGEGDEPTYLEAVLVQDARRAPNMPTTLRKPVPIQVDGFHGQSRVGARVPRRAVVFANGHAVDGALALVHDLRAARVDTVAVLRLGEGGAELSSATRSLVRRLVRQGARIVVVPGHREQDAAGTPRDERTTTCRPPPERHEHVPGSWMGDGSPATWPAVLSGVVYQTPVSGQPLCEQLRVAVEPGAPDVRAALHDRDVYVLGGAGWCAALVRDLRDLGVPLSVMHREYPAWEGRRLAATVVEERRACWQKWRGQARERLARWRSRL